MGFYGYEHCAPHLTPSGFDEYQGGGGVGCSRGGSLGDSDGCRGSSSEDRCPVCPGYCSVEEPDATTFSDIIAAVKEALLDNGSYSIVWANRNANVVAHKLVRLSYSHDSPYYWVEPLFHVDDLLDICASCM